MEQQQTRNRGNQMEKKLTDVHTHLEQLGDEERERVLSRARNAGLTWIVTSGMDLETSSRAVHLAQDHKDVLAMVGVHPWNAASAVKSDLREGIESIARGETVSGIGETGLDFIDNVFSGVTYHDNEDLKHNQEEAFRWQFSLAKNLRLPLLVHSRGANKRLISILREEGGHVRKTAVHNFEGTMKEAHQLADMGIYLSFGTAVTYPESGRVLQVARNIPLDCILTETDSPYMPMYRSQSEKNEPANVMSVVRILAQARSMDPDELADALYRNFLSFFSL
jgi:TatD DNase family protein